MELVVFFILCITCVESEGFWRSATGCVRSTPSNELPPREDIVRTDAVSNRNGDLGLIPQELLRKYISYGRVQVHPVMHSGIRLDKEEDFVSLSLFSTPLGVSFVRWRSVTWTLCCAWLKPMPGCICETMSAVTM